MSFFQMVFTAILVALAGIAVYVHRRAVRVFGLKRVAKVVLALVLLLGPVALLMGRRYARLDADWAVPVTLFGAALSLGTIFAGVLLAHVDVLRLFGWLATRKREAEASEARTSEAAAPEPERPVSRREAMGTIASGAAIVSGLSLGGYSAYFGRHDYAIEDVPIAISGLPRTLDGFTIVQLSDIHIGHFVGDWELRAAERLVREARPDLIVLTGDLVDHEPQYAPRLGQLVRRLQPLARHGVAAVPGNHDYYSGIDEVLAALQGGGARVLRNAGCVIGDGGGGFALLGVDDLWAGSHGHGPASRGPERTTGGPDLQRALGMVRPGLPRVLLCHQPEFFWDAASQIQLQLSGHTHGGQVSLGYDPAGLVLPHGYVEGEYQRNGGTLYVNRGFGTAGPPARLGSAPEVSRIILTSA